VKSCARILSLASLLAVPVWSHADQTTNGQVKMTLPDNSVYEGGMKNGLLDGRGLLVFPDGGQYEGEFRKGQYNGTGVERYHNGETYEGEFKNGLYEGTGVYIFASGDRYEGQFKDGEFAGAGKYSSSKGERHEGTFKNWRLDGTGLILRADGYRAEGAFKDGYLNGKGKQLWPGGTKEEGEFKDGQLDGTGVLITATGNKYAGEFRNGKPVGVGDYSEPFHISKGTFILLALLFGASLLLNVISFMDPEPRKSYQRVLGTKRQRNSTAALTGKERFERIAALDDEVQAEALDALLAERGIPHVMKSYHDSAYDGLFQVSHGWGHVEAPKERADEVLQALKDLAGPPDGSESA
jgi:hypothetical protein